MNERMSPLGRPALNAEIDSDVIFTAAVLGFALTRTLLDQPFSFDVETGQEKDAKDKAERDYHDRVVAAVISAVKDADVAGADEAGLMLVSGRTPGHGGKDDAMITGRPGAGMMRVDARNRPLRDAQASNMAEFEYLSGEAGGEEFQGQYHGRGAYTGMIDDVVGGHTLIQPTMRRVVHDPARWNGASDGIWGLIMGNNRMLTPPLTEVDSKNLSSEPSEGMGPLKNARGGDADKGIVQYVHGMSWAMREAQRWGPWTVAYEMAVGALTRKRASCFACTTYMWSSGFPASSTHLGRCESWGLLPDGSIEGDHHCFSAGHEGELERSIARSMNSRWHLDMYHQLREGARLLWAAPTLADTHRDAVAALYGRYQADNPLTAASGGNLFLDAITWHKSDVQRVGNTLSIVV